MTNWSAQFVALDASLALLGLAVFYLSKLLSRKYNAWTTRLRARFPKLNPPPTPQMAEVNYKIMLNLFRICGVALFAGAFLVALAFSH